MPGEIVVAETAKPVDVVEVKPSTESKPVETKPVEVKPVDSTAVIVKTPPPEPSAKTVVVSRIKSVIGPGMEGMPNRILGYGVAFIGAGIAFAITVEIAGYAIKNGSQVIQDLPQESKDMLTWGIALLVACIVGVILWKYAPSFTGRLK